MSVVNVEAALGAEAFGVGDDDTAGAAAMRPSSIHETVIITHISTIDAFHANCITMSRNNHVRAWATHDAVGPMGATSSEVAIRNRRMITRTQGVVLWAKTDCSIIVRVL